MDRSPGFGSASSDLTPFSDLVSLRLRTSMCLTSPDPATRRTVLQKVRGRAFALPLFVNTRFQVLFHSPPGVLFTFPSQYCTLSVTESYLALGGGPPAFPQGSTCLAVLWILLASVGFHVRGFHPLRQAFPKPFCYPSSCSLQSEPHGQVHGLGSSGFARRYFRNRCFFLFLALLRCFSSGGSPCMTMDSSCSDGGSLRRVAPFRYPRITRYLLLPVAFRSLSRLSSALSAKASTLCSLSLDHFVLVRTSAFPLAYGTRGSFFRIVSNEIEFLFTLLFDVFFNMQFSRCNR